MDIIVWAVIGIIAGWLASVLMGTNSSQGIIGDLFLGILGAIVGGFVTSLFNQPGVTGFNAYSILVATLGAALCIWLRRRFT